MPGWRRCRGRVKWAGNQSLFHPGIGSHPGPQARRDGSVPFYRKVFRWKSPLSAWVRWAPKLSATSLISRTFPKSSPWTGIGPRRKRKCGISPTPPPLPTARTLSSLWATTRIRRGATLWWAPPAPSSRRARPGAIWWAPMRWSCATSWPRCRPIPPMPS